MSISTKLVIYPSKYTEEIQGGFSDKIISMKLAWSYGWEQTRPPSHANLLNGVLQTILDTNSTQNIIMIMKAQVHLIPWLYGGEFFQVIGDAGTFTGPEWETQSGPVSKCHFEM
jgi:hypothetical protein